MKRHFFFPPSSRSLYLTFAAASALLPLSAKAASYDSLTTTSYNWSTTTAWSPTAPVGGPGAGDTANLLSVGADRTVIYDAAATGTVGTINITESAAFQNYFEIRRSLAFTNISLLNSANGALARIRLFDANTLDINTGSSVLIGATTGTVVNATVIDRTGTAAGSVNIGGGTLTVASPTAGVTQTVIAPVNLTAGLIDIQSVGSGTSRLQINNNFSATGGTIQFSGTNAANGSLYLIGSNITIGSAVAFSSTTGQFIIGNGSADQTFSIGVSTADFTLRNATTAAGTSTTKTVTSTASGNAIGSILLQNATNTSGTNLLGFKLGSNLNVAAGKSLVSFNLGTPTSTQNTVIDLNGFTYDGTAATSTAFAPANNVAAKIQINSSAVGGTFKAGSFNLVASDIALGPNATLQATGTTANNLGLIASGTGVIDPTARFLYTGSAATLTANRAIGLLEVGDGTNNSTITLVSNLTSAATGNAVTINAQGALSLNGRTLTLSSSGSPKVLIKSGGLLAAGNATTGLTAAQVTVNGGGIISTSNAALTNADFALNLFSSTSGTSSAPAVLGITNGTTTITGTLDLSGATFQNVSIGNGRAVGSTLSGTAGQITPYANTYKLGGGVGNLNVQGALLSGAGNGLLVTGGGVNVASSNVNYTGLTIVDSGGTLSASTDRFGSSSGLVVNNTGIFDLSNKSIGSVNTTSFTFKSLSGNGTVTNSDTTTAAIFTVNGTNDSMFSGAITGTQLAFTKDGTSTLTLTGNAHSYKGATTVNGGTLLVNGNASSATGDVTVASGAVLGGAGALGGATTVNGMLAVGSSAATPGILTFTSSSVVGALTLVGTSAFDLNGTGGLANRGLTYDAVNVTGTLVYGGALTINLNGNTPAVGSTYDLFDFGSQNGTFSSVLIGDGTSYQSSFDYASGVLTITAVPEPSTLLSGLLVLAGLAWHLRRRVAKV